MTGKWETEIWGVSYHVDYDTETGEILTISDWHGADPRANIDRACVEQFEEWWAKQKEARAS